MSLIRRSMLERVQRVLLALLLVIVLAAVTLGAHVYWSWGQPAEPTPVETFPPELTDESSPTSVPVETVLPTMTPSLSLPVSMTPSDPSTLKFGIVAGHWPDDSGAVCPDGLTEVEINLAVAQQVVAALTRAGYNAEVLAEFSPSLDGYQATALVSIHSDSCNVPEATGFKVARVSSSFVPELEDRLVACLIDKYQSATGLRFHRNSITYDMTEYHAFYEIEPMTPAAIIEIGFMGADRRLLTKRQDLVVRGIVDGIECFVDSTR
ncbi:MAG: N-acetylmuramoyl-L-alanine amidase [Chloroflexi bacterium]|nr:N-acetylmuramoyl-L-alanine amidase [Chloroflexota bacterium]MBL7202053.1 N-acetylmuramoyl-L-alanine amidase [Anaerolineae bacterium]